MLYGVSDKVNHNRLKGHLRVSILNCFFYLVHFYPFGSFSFGVRPWIKSL